MKCVLLAGGLGTRLREETHEKPKPMVEVGGRPILWHVMKIYAQHGHTDFVVCLGYLGEVIRRYFLNYEAMTNDFTVRLGSQYNVDFHDSHPEQNFKVTLADTGPTTMTGGRVHRVKSYIGDDDTFMVTYGDGLANVDVTQLVEFHKAHGKIATVTSVQPFSRFGLLDLGDDGTVQSFVEKPQLDGWINAGFFVFDRKIFDYLGDDACVLEQEPLEKLAAEGELMAYRHDGFFYAMDTFREYQKFNEMWDSGKAPWKVWE